MTSLDKIEINSDPERCKRCGSCESVCPSRVFAWAGGEIAVLRQGSCIKCGHCVSSCPEDALSHSAFEKDEFSPIGNEAPLRSEDAKRMFMRRRSCRRFRDEPVSREDLEKLIDMARYAPTPTNAQNVRYIVLTDRKEIEELTQRIAQYYLGLERSLGNPFVRLAIGVREGFKTVRTYRYHISTIVERFRDTSDGQDRLFYGAPAVIVACAPGVEQIANAACNLAAMEILLAAEGMGLGAFYNGYALTALNRGKRIRKSIGIPEGYHPSAVMAVGRPAGEFFKIPPRRKRRIVWSGETS